MTAINFLDCTLRDGGYYNDWDFNLENSKLLIASLNACGVQVIELGYKSPLREGKYYGLFKNCNENYLDFLSVNDAAKYAFMIDLKDYVKADRVDFEQMERDIRHTDNSVFRWVRIATHMATVQFVADATAWLKQKGYKVTLNLMGGSLLSDSEIVSALKIASSAKTDVFYFADSFGAFYPDDIRLKMKLIRSEYGGEIGVHTHDNQGLAYINSLTAAEEGATWIDGTVSGMGRGAGNLSTEQFLLGYSKKYKDSRFSSESLLPVAAEFIKPLKEKYKWGYDFSYMFSGLMNIHPTYCQQLAEGNRYTTGETHNILNTIPASERAKYSREVLDISIGKVLNSEISEHSADSAEYFDPGVFNDRAVLIMARGAQALNNIAGIINLVNREKLNLIECNPTGYLSDDFSRYLVILNQNKLRDFTKSSELPNVYLIAGQAFNYSKPGLRYGFLPVTLGKLNLSGNTISIPDYDAGLYAIALALKGGASKILLAGFDGFDNNDVNTGKETWFRQFKEAADEKGREIFFVTPSKYKTFRQSSIYNF